MVTPVYKAFTCPGTRNTVVERPGRCQPCPLLGRQRCELWHLRAPPPSTPGHCAGHPAGTRSQQVLPTGLTGSCGPRGCRAAAQPFQRFLRVLARFFPPLPALTTLGRWYEKSIFLQKGNLPHPCPRPASASPATPASAAASHPSCLCPLLHLHQF